TLCYFLVCSHLIHREEELWTILEQEELNGRKETDTTGFPFTAAPLKREDDEGISLFSQLHQQQKEARDLPSSISADQMVAAAAGGEDSGRAETKDNPSSSETAVSEEDEEDNNVSNLDFQLKQLPDSGPKIEDNDSDWTESKSPRCSECSELFVNNRSHHRINSSTCLVKMKGDAVKNDIDSLRNIQTNLKSFSCHNCGKTCTSKTALNTHRVKHKGGVNCELCGHRFRNKKLLNRHKRVHTGYKKYICDVCGHRFSNKSHLDMHTRSHTGEKPFACNLCELKFSRNTHLNRHMKIHTGEKQGCCCSQILNAVKI
uniref:C2H2-type domain-containing protein n=1 Tax=Kryptolebias marmoratus TaxID=37003 RepID=A0A3Q3GUI1_KRYMA